MEQKITFKQATVEVLKQKGGELSGNDLWKEIVNKGIDKKIKSEGKTPWDTIASEISNDIKNNPNSMFYFSGAKPRKFGLKQSSSNINNQQPPTTLPLLNISSYNERDLHPYGVNFARENQKVYCKTIYNEKSKKGVKGYSEWTHPDIVGFSFPFDMNKNILEMNRYNLINLFSYELKKELSMGVLREYYFQAVSNSAWANEGYLMVENIDWGTDDSMYLELKRLTSFYGIGLIQLNIDDLDKSEILFSAKHKDSTEVDWDFVNKLIEINPDFASFIEHMKLDVQSLRLVSSNYDEYKTASELMEYTKKLKNIK